MSDQAIPAERKLPPVATLSVTSMALVIVAGIYLAAHLPVIPPLAPAVGLLAAAGAVLLADVVIVSRLENFAWPVFFRVAGWALVAYAVIAGMLAFVFVFDHTRGAALVTLVLSLLVFALDVPLLLGFSVARYEEA